MCTAISDGALFGRTLDLEFALGEAVVITPRSFKFSFLHEEMIHKHYAMIGVAHVADGTPLYYDAMNEAGLYVAALNFPSYCAYFKPRCDKHNVASFELIPWILSICTSVLEARELLMETCITDDSFSDKLGATPLHFMVCDREACITVESVASGLCIHENPVGVMTNSPPFEHQLSYLSGFMSLSACSPENKICPTVDLLRYSRGMGAIGLPGDYSSPSRFVRAVYSKHQATKKVDKTAQINRFFHVTDTVSIPLGCVKSERGEDVFTVYSSCADADELNYYFVTYDNRSVRRVALRDSDLEGRELTVIDMNK